MYRTIKFDSTSKLLFNNDVAVYIYFNYALTTAPFRGHELACDQSYIWPWNLAARDQRG